MAKIRITSLELENIGVFENLKLKFPKCPENKAEIHIITGVNGSGKSTLLKALASVFDVAHPLGGKCLKETNKFIKYLSLRGNNDLSSCIGKVTFDDDVYIKFEGCIGESRDYIRHSIDRTSLEASNVKRLLIEYKEELNPEYYNLRPKYKFRFAVFSYSGYRFVDYSDKTTPNLSPDSKHSIENPLYQSLDFVKDKNPAYSLDNWVITSLLKKSYAKENNLKNKIKTYGETIERLSSAISKIVGFPIAFVLDDNLRYVNIAYNDLKLDFDVIPDGLKSIISWLADLCVRIEGLDWEDDVPVFDRNIILFLDEIENHLHIKWQRMILPVIQDLLPNAQIFITTHSPFILNSVDNCWIHNIKYENGESTISDPIESDSSNSYMMEVMQVLGLESEYGIETQKKLEEFYLFKEKILNKEPYDKEKFENLMKELESKSQSINSEIQIHYNSIKDLI